MKCDDCVNARAVISENGIHSICCLSDKVAMDCLMEKKDQRVPKMVTRIDAAESEEE